MNEVTLELVHPHEDPSLWRRGRDGKARQSLFSSGCSECMQAASLQWANIGVPWCQTVHGALIEFLSIRSPQDLLELVVMAISVT